MRLLLRSRRAEGPCPSPWRGVRRRLRSGHEERGRNSRLTRDARRAQVCRGRWGPHRRLVGAGGSPPEDRHDDEPPPGHLVVPHHCVAVVGGFAHAPEAVEDRARGHGAVKHLTRRVEALSLTGEDRQARVHDLHDVVGAHGQAVVGRVAPEEAALGSREARAQAVEARRHDGSRAGAL